MLVRIIHGMLHLRISNIYLQLFFTWPPFSWSEELSCLSFAYNANVFDYFHIWSNKNFGASFWSNETARYLNISLWEKQKQKQN